MLCKKKWTEEKCCMRVQFYSKVYCMKDGEICRSIVR